MIKITDKTKGKKIKRGIFEVKVRVCLFLILPSYIFICKYYFFFVCSYQKIKIDENFINMQSKIYGMKDDFFLFFNTREHIPINKNKLRIHQIENKRDFI